MGLARQSSEVAGERTQWTPVTAMFLSKIRLAGI